MTNRESREREKAVDESSSCGGFPAARDRAAVSSEALEVLEFREVLALIESHCSTEAGRMRVMSLAPFESLSEAEGELGCLEEAMLLEREGRSLRVGAVVAGPLFERLRPDGAVLEPGELVEFSSMCGAIRSLRRRCDASMRREAPGLHAVLASLPDVDEEHSALVGALDPRRCAVRDDASPLLARLKREYSSMTESIQRRLESFMRRRELDEALADRFVTIYNERYVIPVKADFKGRVRGVVQGVSRSGQTVFMEPLEIVEANNELLRCSARIAAEIHRIRLELSDSLRRRYDELFEASRTLAWLDSLQARASWGVKADAAVVRFGPRGAPLRLKRARHPLVGAECVPVDLSIEPPVAFAVISGANSGGKTVALKTVGLTVLMLKSGIPALVSSLSEVPWYDGVFCEIGDRQSIAENLSSFSSHVRNVAAVYEHVRGGDLVLLDEFMSGTDPGDGECLGTVLLRRFADRGVHGVVTTHYEGFKALAAEDERFLNYSVEFDWNTLSPRFRLRRGVPAGSCCFEIAERFGLPRDLVEEARRLKPEEGRRLESLIAELERELERRSREAELERAALEEERRRLEGRSRELERERRKLRDRMRRELESFRRDYLSLRDELASLRSAVRRASGSGGRSSPAPVGKRLAEAASKVEASLRRLASASRTAGAGGAEADRDGGLEESRTAAEVSPGVEVELEGGWRGTVTEVNHDASVAFVECGGVVMRVPLKELAVVKPARGGGGRTARVRVSGARNGSGGGGTGVSVSDVPMEISIRGMTVQEAFERFEHWLDRAYARGYTRVRVVHGKGRGILRRAVAEYLRSCPFVEEFGPAGPGEGDFGVTVISFKRD